MQQQRELRELTRYRTNLIEEHARCMMLISISAMASRASMLRCRVNLIACGERVGVQIVLDQADALGGRKGFVRHISQLFGVIV